MTESPDLVIFDWDGTVVDSTPTITQAILNACRDIGIAVPAAQDASWVIVLGLQDALSRIAPNLSVAQQPFYLFGGAGLEQVSDREFVETQNILRLVNRQIGGTAIYPLNRFTRFEFGANFSNIDYQTFPFYRVIDISGFATPFERGPTRNLQSVNNVSPTVAFVTDNTIMGVVGPLSGRRARFQISPQVGTWQWMDYLVDARAYYPIIINYLTFATRFTSSLTIGRDEAVFPKWIGRPDFVRGFNRSNVGFGCGAIAGGISCTDDEAVGSRVAFANTELRFPVARKGFAGGYFGLPPVDGLVFYDAGIAWNKGQNLTFSYTAGEDPNVTRSVLQSYGFGLRTNIFGFLILRWDYAVPINRPNARGFGTWFFGANF
jgi:outer membrane protein assembly factor BamA